MKKILVLILTFFISTVATAKDVSEFFSNLIPGEGITEASIEINDGDEDQLNFSILGLRNIEKTNSSNFFTQFSLMNTEVNNKNRLITIAGSGISDGSATCGTKGGSAGTASANAVGAANGTNGVKVVAAGVQGSPLGNAGTPLTAITSDSTAGAGANGNVGNHTFFSWRVALSTTFIYDGIVNPSVSVAFGTNTAMGFTSGGGTACIAYAAAPDVTITIN